MVRDFVLYIANIVRSSIDEIERSGSEHTSPEARFAWGSAEIGAARVLSTTRAMVNFMSVDS